MTTSRCYALNTKRGCKLKPVGAAAEEDFFSQHTLESLACAFECLSAEERQIIEICYWQEKSLREAAFIMGLSYGAVKFRHRAALEKLRVYMQSVC